jgi:hypothetical protein
VANIIEELRDMRRKLIKQDAFEQIANTSINAAATELVEAGDVLAKKLGKNSLSLHCFNESTAVYESDDETYVHAGYEIENGKITFQNIEELVVDHDSKKEKQKAILSEVLDAVLTDNNEKASDLYKNYLGLHSWNESKKMLFGKDDKKDGKKMPPWLKGKGKDKDDDEEKDGKKVPAFMKKKGDKKDKKGDKKKSPEFIKNLKGAGKKIEEAWHVANNVLTYVEFVNLGPILSESAVATDESGNVVGVQIPTVKVRNEGKVLKFNWRTLNEKCKNLRESALSLYENQSFCKLVANLKTQNNVSNPQALEESLEEIVKEFPQVLYATQSELAQVIGECLRVVGVSNYGDQECAFMAEGVLRHAHDSYSERVNQILHLASAPKVEQGVDAYEFFQSVVEQFYPAVDEKFELEGKVFADLYESFESIYKAADRRGDRQTMKVSASYLNDLADVLNGDAKAEVSLAEEAANFLVDFIEANLPGAGSWNVSNKPHVTVVGDHPDMAKKASVDGVPGKYKGDWGDEAPMIGQDDNNYKGKHSNTARKNSWGNQGGSDTFPSLKNPYVPKPFGDYTMKGEKGVDKEATGQHHSTWQSKDTWPALQNPYVPKAETPKSYKMKEKDLIVDK